MKKNIVIAFIFLGTILMAGAQGWAASGLQSEDKISVDTVRKMQQKKIDFILFDARGKKSYELAHIDGARLPFPENFYRETALYAAKITNKPPDRDAALREGTSFYPKDAKIVTYCSLHCQASAHLLIELKRLGFKNVRAMEEGIDVWREKGYPITAVVAPLPADSKPKSQNFSE